VTVTLSLGALATACSSDDTSDAAAVSTVADDASTDASDTSDATGTADAADAVTPTDAGSETDSTVAPVADGDFYDGSVHSIDVSFDQADLDAAIAAYQDSGEKAWIEVTVTIDGTEYAQAGMRLKGNSSLMSISGGPGGAGGLGGAGGPGGVGGFPGDLLDCATDAEATPGSVTGSATPVDPTTATAPAAPAAPTATDTSNDVDGVSTTSEAQDLPWLIRLDKFVDDQNHQGRTDFVVRSNNTETALNEAVALAALAEAGLATQQSAPVRFTANGSDAVLRLVIEHPDDEWTDATFGDGASSEGVLFQADAQGDYSYRGDDPTAYAEAWDHEAGEEDYTPLIEFLDFVNNSTDEEFAAGLGDRLDIESFARYLAIEELLGNFDDIDGPGNNSYLYFDADGTATVVAWDHNLALNGAMGPGGAGGGFPAGGGGPGRAPGGFEAPDLTDLPEGCELPEGFELPDGFEPPEGFELPEGFEVPEGFEPGQPPEGVTPGGAPTGPTAGGAGGSFGGGNNALVNRFLAVEEFQALYEQAGDDLAAELVDSGFLADTIEAEATVLREQAADLVDDATIDAEAEAVGNAVVTG
jgi:spore coat protein CotH